MSSSTEVTDGVARKRILYVITKANWGGAQRYVFDLAKASTAAGHDVLVVAGMPGTLTERLEAAGVATKSISSLKRDISLGAELSAFQTLRHIVGAYRPDVIHGNSSKAGLLAALAGRMQGVKRIVFTAHGWAFNESRPFPQKALLGLLHYVTVLLSHTTICVSGALRSDARLMPFVKQRLVVIRNGIGPFTLLERQEARLRIAPDMARSYPKSIWIGSIAELHQTKGLDTLIEAFAAYAHEEPSTVLVIMGEGQEWAKLAKLVQIYDLADRVVLAGFVNDAASHLSALDVFVLSSRSEALGYALLEAGAASLASVGTRVGGIPEILTDRTTGLLVTKDESVELADAIHSLTVDPALRLKLGSALYAHVHESFSLAAMTEATLALYTA